MQILFKGGYHFIAIGWPCGHNLSENTIQCAGNNRGNTVHVHNVHVHVHMVITVNND